MKRLLILLLFCPPFFAYGSNTKSDLLNIYIDQLINEFDKSLVLTQYPLTSSLYRKILAGRSLLENQYTIEEYGKKSLVNIDNLNIYHQIIKEVEEEAQKINFDFQAQKSKKLYIYPSEGPDGNLTGNTYPKGVWSLTFDDGPRGERTQKVVEQLYSSGVKATFFMLTSQAKRYPKTVDFVLDHQMEIALHSYTHANLSKADEKTLMYEIEDALKDLQELTYTSVGFFRLPYGAGTRLRSVRETIANKKMVHVFWNVDTLDWKDKDPKSIVNRAKLQMSATPKQSGIILFHDIHAQTVIASKSLMDDMLANQLTLCTVGEVTKYINGEESDCPVK